MREITMTFTSRGDASVGDMPYTIAVVNVPCANFEEQRIAESVFMQAAMRLANDRCTAIVRNGFTPLNTPSIYDEIKHV